MTQYVVMSAAFAAISTGIIAVGMFIRDLIYGGRPVDFSAHVNRQNDTARFTVP